MLAVKTADGKLKSIVFGYACHATVLSFYQWSGDYPGFAQQALEESHPGCQAMFFAGCGADQNPLPRRGKSSWPKSTANDLRRPSTRVLGAKLQPVKGELRTSYREIPLKLGKLPDRDALKEQAASKNRFEAARAKMLLAKIEEAGSLAEEYPYPVQVWQLGKPVQLITLGGEVVVDYAVRLKSERDGPRTWVAGYANDVMAYIPSRRVLREGGYEGAGAMVYYGLPTIWSPAVERDIVQEVHSQAGR